MKIRMKTAVSGSRNGVPWPPRGGTVELPDDEAAGLCASGMAEPVADDEVETATVPDDAEERALTTETAAPVTPSAPAAEAEPMAPPKKASPARKATAKKTAPAKPARE
ncbi:hypothetical protein ACVB8X_13940 [Streptomyces sp. NRAIS4]